jgi:hypothetical protein
VISKDEIEAKAEEFGIHISNVERDYVFGWLLVGIYSGPLKELFVLKSGNASVKPISLIQGFPMTSTFQLLPQLMNDF